MVNVSLLCKCGHREAEHLILKCDICDCDKYETIGRVYDEYESVKLEKPTNEKQS